MKVPPNDSGSIAKKLLEKPSSAPAPGDAVKIRREHVRTDADALAHGDTVRFAIGKVISEELHPQQIEAVRSERVAEIKKLLAERKYNPSSTEVAQKMAEYIEEEVSYNKLLSPAADSNEGEAI